VCCTVGGRAAGGIPSTSGTSGTRLASGETIFEGVLIFVDLCCGNRRTLSQLVIEELLRRVDNNIDNKLALRKRYRALAHSYIQFCHMNTNDAITSHR
jgi:hypothetical protein